MSARGAWIQLGTEEPRPAVAPVADELLLDPDELERMHLLTTRVAILREGAVRRYALMRPPKRRPSAVRFAQHSPGLLRQR